jgi:aminomethyltransferase
MSAGSSDIVKQTPLNAVHRASGARMVEFGGWDMPLEYSGITAEHLAVRTRAGLFDVSHMGEVEIAGANALELIQRIACNDASKLAIGQAQYSALTTPTGTFIDDVLVYRLADEHYLMVVNASNIAKDAAWINAEARAVGGDLAVVNASARYALIAVQGPQAGAVLQGLTTVDLDAIKYYWFASGEVASVRATISRTGYTGEDGFELFVPPAQAPKLWQALLDSGRDVDLIPCGLGARDTLRLEASMRLCGTDMDETTTPLEAGLGWIVGWQKASFNGAERLREQRAQGVARRLVGFEMLDRAIARHGHAVLQDGAPCGVVTSGTQTPFLKKAIGLAMVPVDLAAVGTRITIDVRGRQASAQVVAEPFYRRAKPARTSSA